MREKLRDYFLKLHSGYQKYGTRTFVFVCLIYLALQLSGILNDGDKLRVYFAFFFFLLVVESMEAVNKNISLVEKNSIITIVLSDIRFDEFLYACTATYFSVYYLNVEAFSWRKTILCAVLIIIFVCIISKITSKYFKGKLKK